MDTFNFTKQDVRKTLKKKDAWWTVVLVDPVAQPIVRFLANHTNITPNQITAISFTFGMLSALCLYLATPLALILGPVFYYFSFLFDCLDGKIARLKKNGSTFGGMLDIGLDHIRVAICMGALAIGQFNNTGDHRIFYLAIFALFAYYTRHVHALEIFKLRRKMESNVKKIQRGKKEEEKDYKKFMNNESLYIGTDSDGNAVEEENTINNEINGQLSISEITTDIALNKETITEETNIEVEVTNTETLTVEEALQENKPKKKKKRDPRYDMQSSFKGKFQIYLKLRKFLLKRRIRMHLFSGIEFQMFIFIVAPLIGYIKEVMFLGTIFILMFEAAIIYKLVLQIKDYDRIMGNK